LWQIAEHITLDYACGMRRILVLAALLTAAPLLAETGYRVVHPDGTVEFTDQPTKGAKEIQIEQVPTFPAQPPSSSRRSSSGTGVQNGTEPMQDRALGYESLAITYPRDQETVWFDEKGMTVTVSVRPELAEDDKIIVRLDGVKVASERSTHFTLKNIHRGSHTLSVAITNAKGGVIREAAPVTFFMHQRTVLNPNSPQYQAPTPTPTPTP
jgi:hypothetical protein